MNRIKVSRFKTINKAFSPRDIPNDVLQDGRNIYFEDGRVKTRPGYNNIGSNLPLNGAVTCVTEYKELRSDTVTKIALTENKSYEYNTGTGEWDEIAVVYNTGTVDWPTLGTAKEFSTGAANNCAICSPASGKIAIAFSDADDANKGKCVVGTVADNGTITLGAVSTFTANAIAAAGTTGHHIAICSPSSNKIVIAFIDNTDSDKGKCISATISGTTLSAWGAESEFGESAAVHEVAICSPSSDKIAVAYADTTNSRGYGRVTTLTGTTINTWGDRNAPSSGVTTYMAICSPDTDKVAFAYVLATKGYCKVNTISGSTLGTWGVTVTLETAVTTHVEMCSPSTNKVCVVWKNGSDTYGYMKVATISTTTLTFGSSSTCGNIPDDYFSICKFATDKVAFASKESQAGAYLNNARVQVRYISGTTLGNVSANFSMSDAGVGTAYYVALCSYADEKLAIAVKDGGDSDLGNAVAINLKVIGTTTSWDTGWPSDTCSIKFGTTDPDGVGVPDVWFDVDSFESATVLILDNRYPGYVQSADDYVIRIAGSSGATDYYDACNVIDDLTAQNEWLITTNGVDDVNYYDGSTSALQNLGAPVLAKYCIAYYDHLLLGNCDDGGVILPQSIYWSVRGDPTDFTGTGSGYVDLINNDDVITGMEMLKQRMYVFKTKSIVECNYTSVSEPAFIFNENFITGIGAPSGRTIVNTGEKIFFLGEDNVYAFNGFQTEPIGDPIIDDLLDTIDTAYDYKFLAFDMPTKNLYVLLVVSQGSTDPDIAYVYDYLTGSWSIWEFAAPITAACVLEDSTIMLGDSAGYVYDIDFTDTDDDGTDIDAYIITKDFEFLSEAIGQFTARVCESVVRLADKTGQVQISCSLDHGTNYSLPVIINQDVTDEVKEHVQNWFQRGRNVQFKIENLSGSEFEIESFEIGIENAGTERR